MKSYLGAAALLACTAIAVPASAATIAFSGSRNNVDAPGPAAARCGARLTTNVVHNPPTSTSVGVSNLGAFTPTLSHCFQPPLSTTAPTPFDLGEFTFDFGGGDTLLGTYSGFLTFVSSGLYAVTQTHVVTGGTGFYLGASGGFDSSGTLSFPNGRPTVAQTFSGLLNVPGAVPEPGTWAMLILGFGIIGAALRRRSSGAATQRASLAA
jgi:hypothetical protein